MAMAGMLAGVAAVIFDVVIRMAASVIKQKRVLPLIVMAGAFAATYFFSVNIIFIILACGAIGAADVLIKDRSKRQSIENVSKEAEK